MTVAEAADYLRLSKATLDKMRMKSRQGEGPEFVRLGKRRVAYDQAALDRWARGEAASDKAA